MAAVPRVEHPDHHPADIIADIDHFLQSPSKSSHVLLINGKRGSGKSLVLHQIADFAQSRGLITIRHDFYPIDGYRASAIEKTIQETLRRDNPETEAYFQPYSELRNKITLGYQSGAAFATSQKEAGEVFIKGYNEIASKLDTPIIFLIDNAEYAIDLDDQAVTKLLEHREPNWGGEHWLLNMLPAFTNTITILAGDQYVPYGLTQSGELIDVDSYTNALHALPLKNRYQTISFTPDQSYEHSQSLLKQVSQHHSTAIGKHAAYMMLTSQLVDRWNVLAQGNPFWLTLCLSAELLGLQIAEPQSVADRVELIKTVFLGSQPSSVGDLQGVLALLRMMIHLRKGVSLALLEGISSELASQEILDNIVMLPIVYYRDYEDGRRYFLNEEIERQIDLLQVKPEEQLLKQVITWHNEQLDTATLAHNDTIRRLHSEAMPEGGGTKDQLEKERFERLERRFHIEVDRLFYLFSIDSQRGLQEYNVMAYNAILHRNYGFNVTLRQEGLRNLYRLFPKGFSEGIGINNAAFWMLRAAHSDPRFVSDLRNKIKENYYNNAHYTSQAEYRQPMAFLRLADAQAIVLGYSSSDDLQQAGRLLEQAKNDVTISATPGDWDILLMGQINHWQGAYYAEQYQYQDAIQAYMNSLKVASKSARRSRGLRAFTKTFLSAAYAEQGDINDAIRLGHQALIEQQNYAWDYHVAQSYIVQSRTEIRAGRMGKAQEYAQQGVDLFKALESNDRLIDALLTLAHAWRKVGDDRPDKRELQFGAFNKAAETAADMEKELDQIQDEQGRSRAPQRRCDLTQFRGCLHRSRGYAYKQMGKHEQAGHEFDQALHFLEQARRQAEALPSLVQLDILEDIIATLVLRNPQDNQVNDILYQAMALVDSSYILQEDIGIRGVAQPINGFWRELGQCELQQTLQALYICNLAAIGDHMFKMVAYFLQYGQNTHALRYAEELVLDSLSTLNDEQLRQVSTSARQVAKVYKLTDQRALQRVEDLIRRARRDRITLLV